LAIGTEAGGMKTRGSGAKKETGLSGWPLTIVLAVVTLVSCSGCIWLAIPSLAYEGYKYEKTGSFTGTSTSSSASTASSSAKSQNSDSNNDNSSGGGSEDHSIE
jgi:hypothetical protein